MTLDIAHSKSLEQTTDLLKCCRQLKHLTMVNTLMSLVSDVVVSLATWTIRGVQATEISKILDLLQSASVPLAKLERLALHSYQSIQRLQRAPQWPQLRQRCRQEKIEDIYGNQ